MYNFARKNPTARLTSVSSLLLVLGGKTQLFLTPPPHMFHQGISTGLNLIV